MDKVAFNEKKEEFTYLISNMVEFNMISKEVDAIADIITTHYFEVICKQMYSWDQVEEMIANAVSFGMKNTKKKIISNYVFETLNKY